MFTPKLSTGGFFEPPKKSMCTVERWVVYGAGVEI